MAVGNQENLDRLKLLCKRLTPLGLHPDEALGGRLDALDYLVALGTHRPMSDAQLSRLIGRPVAWGRAGSSRIFNHRGSDPGELVAFLRTLADGLRKGQTR